MKNDIKIQIEISKAQKFIKEVHSVQKHIDLQLIGESYTLILKKSSS